jgi:hypothetical protein
MRCDYSGEVTLTTCAQGYRLRIVNQTTISIILSRHDLETLLKRGAELLCPDEDDNE